MKEIRTLFGLTQKQFAESLGMSREGYQKVESGENNLSLDVLERMKRIYGISADYLLFGELKHTEIAWDILQECSEPMKMEMAVRLMDYFAMTGRLSLLKKENEAGNYIEEIVKKADDKGNEECIDFGRRLRIEKANL